MLYDLKIWTNENSDHFQLGWHRVFINPQCWHIYSRSSTIYSFFVYGSRLNSWFYILMAVLPLGFFFLLQSLGFFCNLRKKNLLHCCLASHKNQLFSLLGNVFAKGWTRHKASSTFHARTASLESLSFLWWDGVLQTRPWTMWVFFFVLFLLFISHVLQFTLTNVAVSLRLRN